MTDNFTAAFDLVLKHEGGYINDPRDPGGKTKFGISDRRDGKVDGLADIDGDGVGDKSIELLPLDDARNIYKREYWDRCKCDALSPALATALFDTAVNCGNGLAVRLLQRVLRVKDDGVIGPVTIRHANNSNQEFVVTSLLAERQMHYAALSTWKIYGRGWSRRTIETGHFAMQLLKTEQ